MENSSSVSQLPVLDGSKAYKELNQSFSECLSMVCPEIQYPVTSQTNPVQQDAKDASKLEESLSKFFQSAKTLEVLFTKQILTVHDEDPERETAEDVEKEIEALEEELDEKNKLIKNYMKRMHKWTSHFEKVQEIMEDMTLKKNQLD